MDSRGYCPKHNFRTTTTYRDSKGYYDGSEEYNYPASVNRSGQKNGVASTTSLAKTKKETNGYDWDQKKGHHQQTPALIVPERGEQEDDDEYNWRGYGI